MQGVRRVVKVPLGERSYSILIGAGLLKQAGEWVRTVTPTDHVVVITDSHVSELYCLPIQLTLVSAGLRTHALGVKPGERSKSPWYLERLWEDLVSFNTTRNSVVVALGGGVVGDLAGFVAATFARGLRFLQIPTTLLAQVDSSVGGKVGINLSSAKNMVGAFWQPAGVLADTDTLTTLPKREYRAGLAEVVKYGAALDEAFFAWLEERALLLRSQDLEELDYVIARCCELKATIVVEDERETTGRRAVLNYGHTFAHAFETLTGYGTLLHGEAVAMGMACAARLAQRLGMIDAATVRRQNRLLKRLRLPTTPPKLDVDKALAVMRHDKKAVGDRLRFVLLESLGRATLVEDVPIDDVRAVLQP
ncbi:MAG: 3-dehydroquinate synthase [Pirellulales bacterium]|nr:3-dehydroquinate synthase [Pirellulales bacterium]